MRPLHSRHFLLLAVGVLGSAPALQCQTQQQAQMVRPFTISSGGQDVQFAAGQTVTVLGIANGKATIRARTCPTAAWASLKFQRTWCIKAPRPQRRNPRQPPPRP